MERGRREGESAKIKREEEEKEARRERRETAGKIKKIKNLLCHECPLGGQKNFPILMCDTKMNNVRIIN